MPRDLSLQGRKVQASYAIGLRREEMASDRRDVEYVQIGAAEGAVGWPVEWRGVGFQNLSRGRKHVDHRSRSPLPKTGRRDNIPLRVETHSVNSAMGSEIV